MQALEECGQSGEMFKFWAEVEQLRQALGVGVAGIFMTKTGFQSGAENAALNPQGLGIEIAVCDETLTTNFDIVFRRYSYERAMLLQQLVAGRGIENSISHTATFGFSVVRNTKTNLD
jgi:hypothetical protein